MIATLLRMIKTLADIVLGLCGLGRRWQVFFYVLVGLAAGSGVVLIRIANATSYLSDSPQTCMNCHVMTDAYASWQRGSHGHAAVCTDCHVPHENMAAKWAFKGLDGTKHSAVFTLRAEPQTLELSATAVPVVQRNCLRCHGNQVQMVRLAGVVEAHFDVAAAIQAKATDDQLKSVRTLLRHAQFRWDYVSASNGMGFHSPQECMRILADAIDQAQQARVLTARILARQGDKGSPVYPDLTTRANALQAIEPYLNP